MLADARKLMKMIQKMKLNYENREHEKIVAQIGMYCHSINESGKLFAMKIDLENIDELVPRPTTPVEE